MDGIKSLSYAREHAPRAAWPIERGATTRCSSRRTAGCWRGRRRRSSTCSRGALHTPPLDDHILDSITRRHVLKVSAATERITTTDDLPRLEEAFLASTLREVHPVHAIDGRAVPAAPGPVSTRAADAVRQHIASLLDGA